LDQDTQVKTLLNNFLTQRKALELSIAKNKRLEEELTQERTKNTEVSEIKKQHYRQVDSLEQDLQQLQIRSRKERE